MAEVFISYAHKDQQRGELIGNILQEMGWDIWQDIHQLRANEDFTEAIASAIRDCSVFLILYSNAYYESPYCGKECNYAVDTCHKNTTCIILDKNCPWETTRFSFHFAGLNIPGLGKTSQTEDELRSLCEQVTNAVEFISLRDYKNSDETGPMPLIRFDDRPRIRLSRCFEIACKQYGQSWSGMEYSPLLALKFIEEKDDDTSDTETPVDGHNNAIKKVASAKSLYELIPSDKAARLVLAGNGGLGKTITLLEYGKTLLDKQPLIYIHIADVHFESNSFDQQMNHIELYIFQRICSINMKFWSDYIDGVGSRDVSEGIRLTLLLDGINELSPASTKKALTEIKEIGQKWHNADLIVSTRSVTRDMRRVLEGFIFCSANAPSTDNVRSYLKSVQANIDDIHADRMLELLRNPLLLMIYVKTQPYYQRYSAIRGLEKMSHNTPDTSGKLLDNYLASQLYRFLSTVTQDEETQPEISAFVLCELVYPYIGWKLLLENRFSLSEAEWRDELKCLQSRLSDAYDDYMEKRVEELAWDYDYSGDYVWNPKDVNKSVIPQLNIMPALILEDDTAYMFQHQLFRDYFAAKFLALDIERRNRQENLGEVDELLLGQMELPNDLVELLSDIMEEERARPVCDPESGWQFPGKKATPNNPSQCSPSEYSRIEQAMDLLRHREGESAQVAVSNTIRVLRYARADLLGLCRFDHLDLRSSDLRNVQFSLWHKDQLYPCSFDGTWLDMSCFSCQAHHNTVSALCPVEDGLLLSGDADGVVIETVCATGKMTGRKWKIPDSNISSIAWNKRTNQVAVATTHAIWKLDREAGASEALFRTDRYYIQKIRFSTDGHLEYCIDIQPINWTRLDGSRKESLPLPLWLSGAYDSSFDDKIYWRSGMAMNLYWGSRDDSGNWIEEGQYIANFFDDHMHNCWILKSDLDSLYHHFPKSKKDRVSWLSHLHGKPWTDLKPDPEIESFVTELEDWLHFSLEGTFPSEDKVTKENLKKRISEFRDSTIGRIIAKRISCIAIHPNGKRVLVAMGNTMFEIDTQKNKVIHMQIMRASVSSACYLGEDDNDSYVAVGCNASVFVLDKNMAIQSSCKGELPIKKVFNYRLSNGNHFVLCTDGILRRYDNDYRIARTRKQKYNSCYRYIVSDGGGLHIAYPCETSRWSGGEVYDYDSDSYSPLGSSYYSEKATMPYKKGKYAVYLLDRFLRVVSREKPGQVENIPFFGGFNIYGCSFRDVQGEITDADKRILYMNGGIIS